MLHDDGFLVGVTTFFVSQWLLGYWLSKSPDIINTIILPVLSDRPEPGIYIGLSLINHKEILTVVGPEHGLHSEDQILQTFPDGRDMS